MQDKLYEMGLKVEKEITPVIEEMKKEYLGILLEETRALSKELENIDIQNYSEIIRKIRFKQEAIEKVESCSDEKFMEKLSSVVSLRRYEDKLVK